MTDPAMTNNTDLTAAVSPVERIETDPQVRNLIEGIALCLSGGLYDNLGLETAWKKYRTILVSDAGGKMSPRKGPFKNWKCHARRVLDVIDNQVRSLRKRQVIDSFRHKVRKGAYWGSGRILQTHGWRTPLTVRTTGRWHSLTPPPGAGGWSRSYRRV